ncbi:MAG: hypothetical protein ISR52_06845 [Rhodospirillales bacterium]|nr:hypothetical protein [Rhodospirillales bacterium]
MKKAFGFLASVLPALAGCDEQPSSVVNNFDRQPEMTWSSMISASSKGPVLATVHGTALGMAEGDFADTVRGLMSGAIQERRIKFTGDEGAAPSPNIRLTVLFGAPKTASGNKICAGQLPDLSQPEDRITVRAVFCIDGDLYSDAEGWVKDVKSADERRFQQFIFDVMTNLFRERDN